MTDSTIPAGPEDVTDDWLTAVLRANGTLNRARIAAHTYELVDVQGAAGVVARLALEYDRLDPGAPSSLVGKFASPYEPIRRLLHAFGGYNREVEFYRQFGADAGIPIPRCFHADIDQQSGVFALLMEDMSDSRAPDGATSCVDDVETAVRYLAAFHAKWWDHPRLRELDFLRYPGGAVDRVFMAQARGALAAALPLARERFGDSFPETIGILADRLLADFDSLSEMRNGAYSDGVTLVHGDFHPGQLFFPSERGGRFAVYDWQTVCAGACGDDLARIIATGLTPEQREATDARLIALYHTLLAEHGVAGYDIERCREGFRLGLITSAIINTIASVNIDPEVIAAFEAEGEGSITDAMFGRLARAIEAHDALAVMTA